MEDPKQTDMRALQTAVNLAREAIAEREASDNPEDQEMLDGYRTDVERAQAALDRMAATGTVAVMAGPYGLAQAAHAAAGAVVTGGRRDRGMALKGFPASSQGPMAMFADTVLGDASPYNVQGEGEDTGGPSNRAARRKRDRDARKAAKVSQSSKRTGKP